MAAPWAAAAPENQLFVLVTGANSGIGLGICQRLVDEFAARHPTPDAHLVLVITTRSTAKSHATIRTLCRDVTQRVQRQRQPPLHPGRIHLASLELDLCRLPSIYAAADHIIHRPLDIFPAAQPAAAASPLTSSPGTIPRLDSVIFNAGIGGWTGLQWGRMMVDFFVNGLVQVTTYPSGKAGTVGALVDPLSGRDATAPDADADADSVLGQVFCANVFGHYVLAHVLLPLMRGPSTSGLVGHGAPRIVWESSVEAVRWKCLSRDDLQGVRTDAAYESSKRLTDVLSLTADLPGVRPYAAPFFQADDDDNGNNDANDANRRAAQPASAPASYVTHPGVVCSTIFPLPWFLFHIYMLVMYLSRLVGSPWHPVTAYNGAAAAVWLALQPQARLDALDARHVKWGAATTRLGVSVVKRTEVEGWGWRGALGEEQYGSDSDAASDPLLAGDATEAAAAGTLRNSVGRRSGMPALTAERRQEFEVLGRDCWREMERLRLLWDARIKKAQEAQR